MLCPRLGKGDTQSYAPGHSQNLLLQSVDVRNGTMLKEEQVSRQTTQVQSTLQHHTRLKDMPLVAMKSH